MSKDQADQPKPDESQEVLLFETSPYGTVDAIVQHDGRSIYFYLNGSSANTNQNFGTRACWVRNLKIGPYVLNEAEAREGIPPMLPRTHCKPLDPGRLPAPDDLEIVWFEEGNAAALRQVSNPLNSTETLAVIPPWSGFDGFHGYASECASESAVCWPMPTNPQLQKRITNAEEFWTSFSRTPDPFSQLQTKIMAAYQSRFLPTASVGRATEHYFSIDGGKFPPRGLVHYQSDERQVLATVAMSLCPQPTVELHADQPSKFRRIEIALELTAGCDEATIANARQALSSLAAYPWQHFNWFGHGHTCRLENLYPGVDAALFVNDAALNPNRQSNLPVFRGDPVQLLWLIPLTEPQKIRLLEQEISVEDFVSQVRQSSS